MPEISENKIVIPSQPALIRDIDEFVEAKLREWGVADTLIADIAICATEIVNNGIYHGNKEDPQKLVTLQLESGEDEIKITITDEGDYFNPDEIANPIAEENLLREVGRGIFIVRQLMDNVTIRQAEGGGTEVTFTKKIA
ncbi:MAG: ATP-binding protein [candidate division Zixibacteria bacterium]|nr:ATP-binding protein [candidate division Zixibacteria bacterium]